MMYPLRMQPVQGLLGSPYAAVDDDHCASVVSREVVSVTHIARLPSSTQYKSPWGIATKPMVSGMVIINAQASACRIMRF